jgi:hypothetical protein
MSTRLQQHGRSIAGGFPTVAHHQGADCGELVATAGDGEPDGEDGFTRGQQIGIALAVLVLIIGGGAAALGGV